MLYLSRFKPIEYLEMYTLGSIIMPAYSYSDTLSPSIVSLTKFQIIQNTMALVKNIKLRKNFAVSQNLKNGTSKKIQPPFYVT